MKSTEPSLPHPYTEAGEGLDIPGLYNDTVHTFTWKNVAATIPAAGSKAEKTLLANVSGRASAGMYPFSLLNDHLAECERELTAPTGELVAIMGPSGSGKTMLLNRLAHRSMPPKAKLSGEILINTVTADVVNMRKTSSYVEQQDHLIGSITTAETVGFAAKLGMDQ